ncbi:MAG: pitrilysin family protein [Gammaproteobacteria bacterium]|nr:pitrilysin family protein [Gammaproteobacteria bacterium]
MKIKRRKTEKNHLTMLLCCLFLANCMAINRQESQSDEENNAPVNNTATGKPKQTIYLNTVNDYQYPPSSEIYPGSMKTTEIVLSHRENAKPKQSAADDMAFTGTAFTDTRFLEFKLDNDLQVFFLPRQGLPVVSVSAIIAAGKHHTDDIDELLSPLLLKLLKQGTKKYPRTEFQRRAALLGEPMTYRQTSRYSIISAEILPQDLALALELISQQLAYINPEENAIRKIIEQQLLENKLAQFSGFYLAKQLFYQNNYAPDHFYFYQEPTAAQIKSVSKKQLINLYQKKYLPEKSKLFIAGDIEPNNLQQQIKKYFSGWSAKKPKKDNGSTSRMTNTENIKVSPDAQNTLKNQTSRIDLINRKGASQADILFGVVTVPGVVTLPGVVTISDPEGTPGALTRNKISSDWIGLKILASLLGGGPSSRLFVDLREKQGLTYVISARQIAGEYRSPFFIQTSVAHDKVVRTISGIKKHLDYLCQHKVDDTELKLVKQQLTGEIAFQFQTNPQWVNNKIHQVEIGLPDDYISDMIRQIKSFTPEQLLLIANNYICATHNVIVVGEQGQLEEDLLRQFNDYRYQLHSLPLQ